ncbi:hypothetical protein DER44DRAFT_804117 [Fusarium oxysporum]|nr:hypothetical protein DER44DRAFT_804117 [Fusarium oxysporum]
MKVVAVAGGTGHVGRPIVESLAQSQSFKVLVLGRKACQDTSGLPASAVYIKVDYDNVEALSQILKHHNAHTLICTIQITDETASSAQRFIVSAWGSLPNEESPVAAFQAASIEQLRRTNLEWTRFAVGFFLDYYGLPNIKTHLPMLTFALDIPHKKAAIPGTGDEPIFFTYTYDVTKFVAAFLDETEWEELTVCYGERTTWNSFLKIAEEVSGQPFEVTYDSVESLQRGAVSELPSHKAGFVASPFPEAIAKQLLAILGIWAVNGQFDIQHNKSLNAKCPDIKPMAVRDALLIGME